MIIIQEKSASVQYYERCKRSIEVLSFDKRKILAGKQQTKQTNYSSLSLSASGHPRHSPGWYTNGVKEISARNPSVQYCETCKRSIEVLSIDKTRVRWWWCALKSSSRNSLISIMRMAGLLIRVRLKSDFSKNSFLLRILSYFIIANFWAKTAKKILR